MVIEIFWKSKAYIFFKDVASVLVKVISIQDTSVP